MRSLRISLFGLLAAVVGYSPARLKTDQIAVLVSLEDSPALRAACPPPLCVEVPLEDFYPMGTARTVILSGDSFPSKHYLHHSPAAVASAIASFRPEIVVLDTCYGNSAPLLDDLAAHGLTPLVVGATYPLPKHGLRFEPEFFSSHDAETQAAAVKTRSGAPLEIWRLDPVALRGAHAVVDAWDAPALKQHLVHVSPNLVKVPIPSQPAELLIVVSPDRFRY